MATDDLTRWLRGDGLEILLIAIGSVLVARMVRWGADRLVAQAVPDLDGPSGDDLAASEARRHRGAIAQVVAWLATFLIYFVAAVSVLQRLNVPVTSLVAPATLVGAAIGFGAQRLVQDVLSGFLLIAERQYGFGDVVRVAQPGETTGISGTVEQLTLRTTTLRTEVGDLVVIPNGEIRQVTNRSRDWARVVLDIPLAADADVPRATEVLGNIGRDIWADDDWSPLLLDAPSPMGIEKLSVGVVHLRFVARTLPGKQFDVGRELRGRVVDRFREAGISAPAPTVDGDTTRAGA